MGGLAILFLILAIASALFGFGNVAAGTFAIDLVFFWVFLSLFTFSIIIRLIHRF